MGSIIGGLFGASAANKAGNIQQQAGMNAASTTLTGMNDAMANIRNFGTQANSGLNSSLGNALYGSLIPNMNGAGDRINAATGQATAMDRSAMNNALNFTSNAYNDTRGAWQPYQQSGLGALAQINSGLAPGGQFNSTPTAQQVMANDPGYQFNLNQGLQAVQRAAAAQGTGASGGALKGAAQYASDYTTNAYQNAYNQTMNTRQANLGNLMGAAGLGTQASNALTGAGMNAASLYGSQNLTGAGLYSGNLLSGTGQQAGYQAQTGLTGAQNIMSAGLANAGIWSGIGQNLASTEMGAMGQYNDYLTSGAASKAAGVMGAGNAWSNAFGQTQNQMTQLGMAALLAG